METEGVGRSEGTLRDFLSTLFKHKFSIITIFVMVVAVVAVGTFRMSPVYEASSKILIKFGRENVYVPTSPTSSGGGPVLVDALREERINSEMEMLKGRNIIEPVVRKMGVKTLYPDLETKETGTFSFSSRKISPLEKAILIFQKGLTVEGVAKSDIIDIRFEHKDPTIAARAVNNLIEVFLEHHIAVYKQPLNYGFFSEQVRLLKKNLDDSENVLQTFRAHNDITSLQEQKTLLLQQISRLEVDLAKTEGEISENEGKLRALRVRAGGIAAAGEAVLGQETDFNPYAVSSIRSKISELKIKEQELLGRYTPDSIPVQNVRNEIEKAGQLLEKEENTYHGKAIKTISDTLMALKSREGSEKQNLENYQQDLNKINTVEMQLKEQERQVKVNEDNFLLYVKKMEEARISNAMDNEKMANISVAEPALPPINPVKPRKLLNLALSIILGGAAGLGYAFFSESLSHTFNNREDVVEQLGLPVLASIPEEKS